MDQQGTSSDTSNLSVGDCEKVLEVSSENPEKNFEDVNEESSASTINPEISPEVSSTDVAVPNSEETISSASDGADTNSQLNKKRNRLPWKKQYVPPPSWETRVLVNSEDFLVEDKVKPSHSLRWSENWNFDDVSREEEDMSSLLWTRRPRSATGGAKRIRCCNENSNINDGTANEDMSLPLKKVKSSSATVVKPTRRLNLDDGNDKEDMSLPLPKVKSSSATEVKPTRRLNLDDGNDKEGMSLPLPKVKSSSATVVKPTRRLIENWKLDESSGKEDMSLPLPKVKSSSSTGVKLNRCFNDNSKSDDGLNKQDMSLPLPKVKLSSAIGASSTDVAVPDSEETKNSSSDDDVLLVWTVRESRF